MNRIFICGYFNFPRGGAAANYVQSLAKVFQTLNKKVIIISNRNLDVNFDGNEYQGIQVEDVRLREDKLGHYMDFNFLIGSYYKRILLRFSIDSSDIFIAYSRDPLILNAILHVAKSSGSKTGVCLVEWFEKKDYNRWFINIEYWKSQISFYHTNLRFDYIFPISTYIEDYYERKKCRTFRMPCLIDTLEYGYKEKIVDKKIIFIFPGNGKMKDALSETIQAFSMLSDNEAKNLEFHICGVNKLAYKIIQENNLEEYLGNRIIVHDWMPYEELVDLYNRTHFMVLARNICQMTRANFPSKIPETLSYGIIPICSKVGDYTKLYLKDGENSILMDGCDSKTILSAIRKALNLSHEELRKLSDNARRTAKEEFDYRVWTFKLKELFLDDGDI